MSSNFTTTKQIRVRNNLVVFGEVLPVGTQIQDLATDKVYILTAESTIANTLATATKEEIGGASVFTELTDTPNAYTSEKHKVVKVKVDESGLEFVEDVNKDETVFGDWTYEIATTAPPTVRKFRTDVRVAVIDTATKMYISDENAAGTDERANLLAMKPGFDYRFHSHTGALHSFTFRVTAVVAHPAYVELGIKDMIITGAISDGILMDLDGLSGGRFIELLDAPANYTGQKGKVVTVRTDEEGVTFSNSSGSATGLEKTAGPTTTEHDGTVSGAAGSYYFFIAGGADLTAEFASSTKIILSGGTTTPTEYIVRVPEFTGGSTRVYFYSDTVGLAYSKIKSKQTHGWRFIGNTGSTGDGTVNLMPEGSARQNDITYVGGLKLESRTSAYITGIKNSELGTLIFDSDLNAVLQCIDANPAAPKWARLGTNVFSDLIDTPADYIGQGSRVVTVRPDATGLEFTTPSGATHLFGEFTYSASTTPPPPIGDFIFNRSNPTAANKLYISDLTASGSDVRGSLLSMRVGSNFIFEDAAEPANNMNFHVTAIIEHTGYVEYSVDHVHTAGTISAGHTFNLENVPAAPSSDDVPLISAEDTLAGRMELASVPTLPASPDADTLYFVGSGGTSYEPDLGNPTVDDQILSSTTAGTRSWINPPAGGGGDVTGPATAVNNRLATFSGTSGKIIQDGGTIISIVATMPGTPDANTIYFITT